MKIIWSKRRLLERDGGLADPRKIRLEIQHLVGLERERSLREMEALRRIENGRTDASLFLQQQEDEPIKVKRVKKIEKPRKT